MQSFHNWELIVVDDGSPEPVAPMVEIFPFGRVLKQLNSGQAIARNNAIAQSTGEYIAFLDQDDFWAPDKLALQVEMLDGSPEMSMCHTQFDFIDAEGNHLGCGFGRKQGYEQLLEGSGIAGASSVMVRRDTLMRAGLFDPICQPAEDYDLWLRLSRLGEIGFIESVETRYRLHPHNQSRRYRNTYRCICAILRKHLVFGLASRNASVVRAARTGLRRIRQTYSGQAIDKCRQNLSEKGYILALEEFAYASSLSPSVAVGSVVQWMKARMRMQWRGAECQ